MVDHAWNCSACGGSQSFYNPAARDIEWSAHLEQCRVLSWARVLWMRINAEDGAYPEVLIDRLVEMPIPDLVDFLNSR